MHTLAFSVHMLLLVSCHVAQQNTGLMRSNLRHDASSFDLHTLQGYEAWISFDTNPLYLGMSL